MTAKEILINTDATINKRKQAADLLLKSPKLLRDFIEIVVTAKDLSVKAAYVIEVLSRQNFEIISQYIPALIPSGKKQTDSSARRCLAKIYNLALNKHYDSNSNFCLSEDLKKEILELSFLWLGSKEKAALQVFSMQNIYDLKDEASWIKEELKGILEKDIMNSSAGYKSRASKILRKL